ncbi:MAG: Smg-4/UPF3 family-domain-containing protein [Piptocephalis tieghemiana]|nr:MAG: Smg-4/UPF3 family-domain-containing protein [Piptocephalis tieghemiana]
MPKGFSTSRSAPPTGPSAGQHLGANRTKVVVRHLPSTLPEHVFQESIAPWCGKGALVWSCYCPGKSAVKKGKKPRDSRAYLAFKTEAQLLSFYKMYNGHVFIDSQDVESKAIVQYAPHQKIPRRADRPDPRAGTVRDGKGGVGGDGRGVGDGTTVTSTSLTHLL